MTQIKDPSTFKSCYINQNKLSDLQEKIVERLDDLLRHFNLDFRQDRKQYRGICPIHNGDNIGALRISHEHYGIWVCWTHHCEETFKKTIIGFFRGVLSNQKYNWNGPGDKVVSFRYTVEYLLNFLQQDYEQLKTQSGFSEQKQFINNFNNIYNIERSNGQQHPTREDLLKVTKIPSEYYLQRGYSKEILEKYDVGLCISPERFMFNRIVVPIYCDNHRYIIGSTGRSPFGQCQDCYTWHNPKESCPEKEYQWKYAKWLHNKGFKGHQCLYNYWYAKTKIKNQKVAILVESPGNVWRLEEAGIHNSLGLFGNALSDGQRTILDMSGTMALITLLDNDSAGRKGQEIVAKQCSSIYNVYNINVPAGDVGEMSVAEVQEVLTPQIQKIEAVYKL